MTDEEKYLQKQKQNERQAISRSRQSETQRQTRQQANRTQMAQARAAESETQRQERLQAVKVQMAQARTVTDWHKAAFNYDPAVNYASTKVVYIGKMDQVCGHCGAKKFKRFNVLGHQTGGEPPGFCCSEGKVKISQPREPPEPEKTLLEGGSSSHFVKNLRPYNSAFNMTSFMANEIRQSGWMPTFKVQGQVYHLIGSLEPQPNEPAKFLQLYFVGGSHDQAEQRSELSDVTRLELIRQLQEMLQKCNPYVKDFKSLMERPVPDNVKLVIDDTKRPSGVHPGRLNLPRCQEVGVIIPGGDFSNNRAIILETKDAHLKRIRETHRSYDAMQYPLLLPWGDDGYHIAIPQVIPGSDPVRENPSKTVSCKQFYAYQLQVRDKQSHLHKAGDLFSQYITDMFVKMDSERLGWVKNHQKEIRVDDYEHLKDAINNDAPQQRQSCQHGQQCQQCQHGRQGHLGGQGQLVILPSSHVGSPRYMHEKTQDGMTYVKTFGRPDLFLTFTCNPKWKEIRDNILEGQSEVQRHDIVARVFKQKVIRMMDLLRKFKIFGPTQAFMYSVEWQKRGLPHVHILLWLKEKIHACDIDKIISAEFPDPEDDPKLFDIVKRHMVHGPCGNFNRKSPCMVGNECSKRFPKPHAAETQLAQDGYPTYRRRSSLFGGHTAMIKRKGQNLEIDNKWVVPYSPILCRLFDAHINVEWCNSVKSIKYVCKYINKGPDAAMFALLREKTRDEVAQYQEGRYASTNEAAWRIFGFDVHEHKPTVQPLSVHLENGQRVYFTAATAAAIVANPRETTLTEFFKLCQRDTFAKTLLYPEVPSHFRWESNKWIPRKAPKTNPVEGYPGYFKDDALGRVYTVHPNQQECFYLRLLLHEVRGPTSFQALKTVDGEVCQTYREACRKLGLLEDGAHWKATLQEASVSQSPSRLRDLFAIMITQCGEIPDPEELWMTFREDMCEDILYQLKIRTNNMNLEFSEDTFDTGLILLETKCLEMRPDKRLQDYGLPTPKRRPHEMRLHPREILQEMNYNMQDLREITDKNECRLGKEQRTAYNTFVQAVESGKGGLFFLDAPGGTGKTFVTNTLIAKIRQQGKIVLAVASSGIAAQLLEGGKTTHYTFKIPLKLSSTDAPTCNIRKGSGQAELIKQCSLIIWDECTMSNRKALEAVDRLLKDLKENSGLMGNVPVILSGDFRQTLPVVPRGTAADELSACLKASDLWKRVVTLRLTKNMRALAAHRAGDASAAKFAKDLLTLGDGRMAHDEEGLIDIRELSRVVQDVDELIDMVFPNVETQYKDTEWLSQRAILAPKNVMADSINEKLLNKIPGQATSYKSVDKVTNDAEAVEYPVEFLNSLKISGVPPHNLMLKIGTPIMLLRNLHPPKLCNGTRLVVKNLYAHVIEATILCGSAEGEDVFIPRIPLIIDDLAFEFKRLQFPVRPCFAMSINKSQGK